jgi:uncharacterized membrane-anchored protein
MPSIGCFISHFILNTYVCCPWWILRSHPADSFINCAHNDVLKPNYHVKMKKILFTVLLFIIIQKGFSQEVDSVQLFFDAVEADLDYQQGKISLSNGIGSIDVPENFRFLNGKQSAYVLSEIWGNPIDTTTLGMLVPADKKITDSDSWAFIVTYEEMGYVEDGDADDIDYEELLDGMRTDMEAENESRKTEGYESITLIGWAADPFYDGDKKVLHWAKELKFGESEQNTLNYNVRILGRKGVLVLNAVSSMDQLQEVKTNIPSVMASFAYGDGNKYSDFDPEVDEIAAWTIGSLVAGKVLAKAGIFALVLKNIKLIGLGLLGLFTAGWKWFKRKSEPPVVRTIGGEDQDPKA